jgi:hypothetical protein
METRRPGLPQPVVVGGIVGGWVLGVGFLAFGFKAGGIKQLKNPTPNTKT